MHGHTYIKLDLHVSNYVVFKLSEHIHLQYKPFLYRHILCEYFESRDHYKLNKSSRFKSFGMLRPLDSRKVISAFGRIVVSWPSGSTNLRRP